MICDGCAGEPSFVLGRMMAVSSHKECTSLCDLTQRAYDRATESTTSERAGTILTAVTSLEPTQGGNAKTAADTTTRVTEEPSRAACKRSR